MALTEKALFLKNIPLFSSLSLLEAEHLGKLCQERKFVKDTFIFIENDEAKKLFIIKSGVVKILKHSESGKTLTIRFVSAGGLIGEVSLFDKKPYPASALSIENTLVYELSRQDQIDFTQKHPAVSLSIIGTLVNRLRDAYTIMQGLAIEDIDKRLAMTLLKLADTSGQKQGKKIQLNFRVSRQDLAEMTGCTKESVSRVMARFKRNGIIKPERGKIIILAPEQLEALKEW